MKYIHLLLLILLSFGQFSYAKTSEKKKKLSYDISISAIFKDEAPWLKEWIEFHKMQGVQHFYLYNNKSSDDYKEVLKPYIKTGDVTLIDWDFTFNLGETGKWLEIQKNAYNHCLDNFGSHTRWLAVIDIDEFLFCPTGKKLITFLADYQSYGGLCVNYLYFGTSHIQNIPKNKLMIEMLTSCAIAPYPRDHFTKSIIQPRYVIKNTNPHAFIYKKEYFSIEADFVPMRNTISTQTIHIDQIRINHYWTRTEQYFLENKIGSRSERRLTENEINLKKRANRYNQGKDEAILQYVPKLRKKMGIK